MSLRKLDKILFLAWDESWMVEARVVNASNDSVELLFLKSGRFGDPQDRHAYTGENFHAVWSGDGFTVHRNGDGVRMLGSSFGSLGAAVDAIPKLSPTQIA